jgi:hypothetical protein
MSNPSQLCNQNELYQDKYVWLIGTFHYHRPSSNFSNRIICKVGEKTYQSGYFWRLFDSGTNQRIEELYRCDPLKLDNNVSSEGFSVEKNFDSEPHVYIKFDKYTSSPIIRMQWKDAKKLLIVGVENENFFRDIFVYLGEKGYRFFDNENQKIINSVYGTNKTMNITVEGKNYCYDSSKNIISDELSNYKVEVYKYQSTLD